MSQEIEIEYKNLITREEYKQLLKTYPFPSKGKKQINHYFETPDKRLQKQGCAIRIREKSNTYTLTLKEPHPSGLLETHDIIHKETFHQWVSGNIIPQPYTTGQLINRGIQPEHLKYMGNLETIRNETNYKGVLLVLDISKYNGYMDYELELEASDESVGLHLFNEILDHQGIEKRSTPNKIKRFYTSLQHHPGR